MRAGFRDQAATPASLARVDRRSILSVIRSPAFILLLVTAARAGAPAWSDGGTGGVNGTIRALTVCDGTAPIGRGLFVGGSFSLTGQVFASNIARWDGAAWSMLGTGVSGEVRAILVFDPDADGPAPALLIAAGAFTTAGGVPASRIAAWNGTVWSALGSGVSGTVNALAVFDPDGDGPLPASLYVGGVFSGAGDGAASNIARWDGASWSAAGQASNEVVALAVLPLQIGGPISLIAGGWFTSIGGIGAARVAAFDGVTWAALGAGLGGPFPVIAQSIARFDSLYVGGIYTSAGGIKAHGLSCWGGAAWSPVENGVGYPAEARAMAVHDDDGDGPNPPSLFVAGNYLPSVGGPGNNIAAWDGAQWRTLGPGTSAGVWALASFDEDGEGPDPAALFIGGEFTAAGGLPIARLARWGVPRTISSLCADANGDGEVNFADITAVLANFNANYSPGTGIGDANRDGVVSFSDITAVLSAWGMMCR